MLIDREKEFQRLVITEAAKPTVKSAPQHAQILNANERIITVDEVDQGLLPVDALREAARCLRCKSPACQFGKTQHGRIEGGCPVGLRIPDFIDAFRRGNIPQAYSILMEDNPLHRITARVCPQNDQCQLTCILSKAGKPIAIGLLERIIGDLYESFYANKFQDNIVFLPPEKNFPIAVIGSGPASLTAAVFLARRGYNRIYMFEAFHQPAGVLGYGIPAFRLPRKIINKVLTYVKSLGVKIITDVAVGRTLTLTDLKQMGFTAIFLGTGAGLPVFMEIPGEELNGVISANEFLTRYNLMSAAEKGYDTPVQIGRKIVVIGGGNVAMDAARWARRSSVREYGAEASEVILIYRRTRDDMPARVEEVAHAEEEGIKFVFLASPVALLEGAKKGWVNQVRCQKMRIATEKDKDGRNQILPVDGESFVIENVDTVIEALGTRPNTLLSEQNKGLLQDAGRVIVKNNAIGTTSIDGVFAGGDAARGGATVILAMGDGKRAADGIDTYLKNLNEDAAAIKVYQRLKNINEWFTIKENKALAHGQTKDGRPYALREMVVHAPLIADKAEPGQFVIVMPDKKGERVPLTLADWDKKTGMVTLVFQEIGASTYKLGGMLSGEKLFSILGPLGHASIIEKIPSDKAVVFVGGGVGIAPVYPIARAHHALGNRVISIIGARNEQLIFWEEKMRAVSDEFYKTLDEKGEFVTHALERLLTDVPRRNSIAHIVAIGPVAMMENVHKTVDNICRHEDVSAPKVIVSLNPIMMDGTGMCGGCRVLVAGSAKYCCVDGPEFEASLVDFEGLKRRQSMYHGQEKKALDLWDNAK